MRSAVFMPSVGSTFVAAIVLLGRVCFEVGDVVWQGIGPIVDQVVGKLALFRVNFGVGRDVQSG